MLYHQPLSMKQEHVLLPDGAKSSHPCTLHSAAWVVPINAPPIDNGAVLVKGDSIVAVGRRHDLRSAAMPGAQEVEHGNAALCPAFVNAHTHLELSCLDGRIPLPQSGFAPWLRNLFLQRSLVTKERQTEGRLLGQRQLQAGGAALYADVSNGSNLPSPGRELFPASCTFWELLGFDRYDLEAAVGPDGTQTLHSDNPAFCLAAHACYSTSAELIRLAKAWSRKRNRPFSIHLAEHPEEIQFLRDGNGFCRDLLESLDKWVSSWVPPRMTPVEYLDFLGVLDEDTLLVHAVHMKDSDWQIVSQRRCRVCFCPRSNHNLSVGQPAIAKCLQLGIDACLGTDSLASNTDLSLFSEAHYILENYCDVAPESLLVMMTMRGAEALKEGHGFGALAAGKRSTFLSISLPGSPSASQLAEHIIRQGHKGEWTWINCPQLS